MAPGADTEGALLKTFTGSPGYEGSVPVPAGGALVGTMLPDNRTYVSVDEKVGVHLVDITTGANTVNFPAIRAKYSGNDVDIDVSPDGRYLALASDGATGPNILTEWDLRTRQRRFPDRVLDFGFGAVSFSPDGTLLAVSGGTDAHVEVRSAHDGTLVRTLPSLPRPLTAHLRFYTAAVRFLPDGTLAVGSQSGVIRILDVRTGAELRRLTGPAETSEAKLVLAPDAHALYGDGFQGVEAWNLATGQVEWAKPASGGICNDIAVGAIIGAVLSARVDDRVQAFDLATGATLAARFDYQAGVISSVNLADHGRLLVEEGGSALGLWRLDGSGPISRVVAGSDSTPQSFVGPHALLVGRSAANTNAVLGPRLVDAQTGRLLDRLSGIAEATPTPRPDRLGALFTDGTAGFYDLTTHHRVENIRVELPFTPTSAAFGGNTLFVAGDGNLQGVDATTGALVRPSIHQDTTIDSVIVDPTGTHIFTSELGAIVVRDASGAKTGVVLQVGNIAVGARHVVTATEDGTLRVLDLTTLRPDGANVESVAGATNALVLSRDEGLLLISLRDGSLRIADMHTRQLIGDPIATGNTTAPDVVAHDDDHTIAAATDGGTVVWDLDPADMVRAACQVASRNLTHAEWNANVIGLGPYQTRVPERARDRVISDRGADHERDLGRNPEAQRAPGNRRRHRYQYEHGHQR